MKLTQSNVVFNIASHTYMLGDKRLSGITGILSKYLFAEKYTGVPDSILARAAERGSMIHSQMDMWINGMPYAEQDDDVVAMQNLLSGHKFISSEYLVSDNAYFASAVDAVEEVDGGVVLWDWKGTYTLDKEYLSWQLSIYKYLFELQTGIQVVALKAGWIKNGAKEVDITIVDTAHIKALLDCAIRGDEKFDNPLRNELMTSYDRQIAQVYELEQLIIDTKRLVEGYVKQEEILKSQLLKMMQERDIKKAESDNVILTIKDAYTQSRIDSKALKEDMPDIYNKYCNTTTVKASLLIKIKENTSLPDIN